MKNNIKKIPYAYLVTFRPYATWLHGSPKRSVHHSSTEFGTPKIPHNKILHQQMENNINEEKFLLDAGQREAVLSGFIFACKKYHWRLFAGHVRTNHAHLVLQTSIDPGRAMAQIKGYGTRFLKKANADDARLKFWARHGSTECIWDTGDLYPTMHYVIEEQGKRMALYYEEWYDKVERFDFY
ncbi:MAG: transposase [Gammaproteobacteria bacterium]|nr:transposase [Gammaproteobacteria bacterium]